MDNKEKRKKKATEGEHNRPWREVYATVEDIQNFLMDRVLSEHNRQFETPRLEKELVGIYFRKPAPLEGGEFIPVGRALQLIGGNMVHELSAIRLGRAFTELGFELKHTKTGNYYRVVQRSAQEIQSLLRCIPEDG